MKRIDFLKTSAALGAGVSVFPSILKNLKKVDPSSLKPKIVRHKEGKRVVVLGDNQLVKLTGKDTDG
ncbi:MAG: cupin domain-containing protein, partial [Flavobacteriales bacterium]|nr:cupin domain-containing protein [Flavobacteriales bacterium]